MDTMHNLQCVVTLGLCTRCFTSFITPENQCSSLYNLQCVLTLGLSSVTSHFSSVLFSTTWSSYKSGVLTVLLWNNLPYNKMCSTVSLSIRSMCIYMLN